MALEYLRENATIAHDTEKKETPETLLTEILSGTSNFDAAVNFLEAFGNRDRESDMLYQKVAYYRGLEFYNDREFENSISLFMRSEKFPLDQRLAALATYWQADAVYKVREYTEEVQEY